jgi:hypothetical protein
MLLAISSLVLCSIGGAFFFLRGSVPNVVAWICLVLACVTLLSRVLAWLTGAALQAYVTAAAYADPEHKWRNNMVRMELFFWLVSFVNLSYFFFRTSL